MGDVGKEFNAKAELDKVYNHENISNEINNDPKRQDHLKQMEIANNSQTPPEGTPKAIFDHDPKTGEINAIHFPPEDQPTWWKPSTWGTRTPYEAPSGNLPNLLTNLKEVTEINKAEEAAQNQNK